MFDFFLCHPIYYTLYCISYSTHKDPLKIIYNHAAGIMIEPKPSIVLAANYCILSKILHGIDTLYEIGYLCTNQMNLGNILDNNLICRLLC